MSFSATSARRIGSSALLFLALALAATFSAPARAHALAFDPNFVLSDDHLRNYDSMSAKAVQTFLDGKPGALKSLVTVDHLGKKKKASLIIYEACRAYRINPKAILTLLQKEQGLLTDPHPTARKLSRAIGAGCPGGAANKYPGFGNQIWNGARLLDQYGEGKRGSSVPLYHYGVQYDVGTQGKVTPRNITSYKLYVYNPSIGAKPPYGDLYEQRYNLSGNAAYWWIFRKYFGNPYGGPVVRPVYRFYNSAANEYVYTASASERYRRLTAGKPDNYQGSTFRYDTRRAANNVPVYRFYDTTRKVHFYTKSVATMRSLRTTAAKKHWRYEGIAFKVSNSSKNAVPVYRFRMLKSGTTFYTASTAERTRMASAAFRDRFKYLGIAWYMAK